MLLLVTTAGDGTSDRIISRLGDFVFRYNFDQASSYIGHLDLAGWELQNPVGRKITSAAATAGMWWKAFSANAPFEDRFLRAEAKYIFREYYSWFRMRGLARGNPPDFHEKFGKLTILSLAKKYFPVPKTVATWGLHAESTVPAENRVVKSLTSGLMDNGRTLFTTDVSGKALDPSFPWFIQEKVDATDDITVFQVRERFFAFNRPRSNLQGLDWRAEQNFDPEVDEWLPFELTSAQASNLRSLSQDLGVEWGRYDLMLKRSGELIFLEFNANGQWVFLDYHEKYGLMDAVADYLTA
jgi:hypothetical protein